MKPSMFMSVVICVILLYARIMKKESVAKWLMLFYSKLFKGISIMFLTAFCGLVLAVCIVYPLWSGAIHSKVVYNWFILILTAGMLIFLVKGRVVPFLVTTSYTFLIAMTAILAYIFFANGFILGTIPAVLFFLVIFRIKKRQSQTDKAHKKLGTGG